MQKSAHSLFFFHVKEDEPQRIFHRLRLPFEINFDSNNYKRQVNFSLRDFGLQLKFLRRSEQIDELNFDLLLHF